MKLFDVYSLFDVTPIKAKDVYVYDDARLDNIVYKGVPLPIT